MRYYADVYLKGFQIDKSEQSILLRLQPAHGFALHGTDSEGGDWIVFRCRDNNSHRGLLCQADDVFIVKGQVLEEFCVPYALLPLCQQHTRFTVELEIGKSKILNVEKKMYEGVEHEAFTIMSITYK